MGKAGSWLGTSRWSQAYSGRQKAGVRYTGMAGQARLL